MDKNERNREKGRNVVKKREGEECGKEQRRRDAYVVSRRRT